MSLHFLQSNFINTNLLNQLFQLIEQKKTHLDFISCPKLNQYIETSKTLL